MPAIKANADIAGTPAPTSTTALRNKPAARARRWCSDRRLRHPLGERVQGYPGPQARSPKGSPLQTIMKRTPYDKTYDWPSPVPLAADRP